MENEIERYKILKEHYMDDYKWEFEKKIHIDNKTSYMIVLVSFLLGLLLNFFVTNNLGDYLNDSNTAICVLKWIIILLYLGATVLCVISIFMYVIVLISRRYYSVKNETFSKFDKQKNNYKDTLKLLSELYKNITTENREINLKVIGKYKAATILSLIAMIMTVVIYILSFFIA